MQPAVNVCGPTLCAIIRSRVVTIYNDMWLIVSHIVGGRGVGCLPGFGMWRAWGVGGLWGPQVAAEKCLGVGGFV